MMKLIGNLEVIAAASEAGIVLTEEMSVIMSITLLNAAKELRNVYLMSDKT